MIVNVTVQEFLTQNVFSFMRREYPSVRQYNLIQKVQKKTTTTATAAARVDEFLGVFHFSHGLRSVVFFRAKG